MNGTSDHVNFTSLTYIMLLHYLVKAKTPKMYYYSGIYETELHEMHIASSKWIRVITCLKFTYPGYYIAMHVQNKVQDDLRKCLANFPAKMLDTKLTSLCKFGSSFL